MAFFNDISDKVKELAKVAEIDSADVFERIETIKEYNQQKVLSAFINNGISESHFVPTSGYGYGDRGRDVTDAVFAEVFGAEDALVRHNFVSGTHALSVALFGILRPGDKMLSITGKPYDTMEEVIGIRGEGSGSLKDFGVSYDQVDLLENGEVDIEGIKEKVIDCKVTYIQRSRGYSLRPSLTIEKIERIVKVVKTINPNTYVVVDNCYGEFCEKLEPTQVGADLIVGSLIKNPGGGIAVTGGYIAGKAELVEKCSYRLTSPGMGKEVGCSLGQTKNMLMGLFFSPIVVGEALKTAVLAARIFENIGYEVTPKYNEYRTDIIQSIKLNTPDALIAFCRGIQKGSPVDAFVAPEPWDMPGYDSQVIMAAGAFNMGASIELSADAPLRDPFAVWMQGGLTYYSAKVGVMLALQTMIDNNIVNL